ncbi:MAG: DUF4145 domain-containing protein [Peptococcaceae bacterium]|nr:DUF4145 domain-containing protein [Peptococcaceae bacterium]
MDRKYCARLICGHCGKKGLAGILAEYSERDMETLTSPCGYLAKESLRPWGVAYSVSRCLCCDQLTLTRVDWHDERRPEDYSYTILYPDGEPVPQTLPVQVRDACLTARQFRNSDPGTCAAHLRRALELACADRRAEGDSICERIGNLAKKGEIPLKIYELAQKFESNDRGGFCTASDQPGIEKEIEFLQGLCAVVFEYLYQAPALLARLTDIAAKN